MTAKKNPPILENQKIWGFFGDEDQANTGMTYKQACDKAIEYKTDYPDAEVSVFRVVATIENNPIIKPV
ncbi:MAG: hypothetical protein ACRC6V_07910 [Bacteroidales bacterium]